MGKSVERVAGRAKEKKSVKEAGRRGKEMGSEGVET